jgi:hypothetical protein
MYKVCFIEITARGMASSPIKLVSININFPIGFTKNYLGGQHCPEDIPTHSYSLPTSGRRIFLPMAGAQSAKSIIDDDEHITRVLNVMSPLSLSLSPLLSPVSSSVLGPLTSAPRYPRPNWVIGTP